MIPDFDPWSPWWQNGPHTTRRSYSTPGKFYPNTRPETGPSKASNKGFYTAEVQESEEEQEV